MNKLLEQLVSLLKMLGLTHFYTDDAVEIYAKQINYAMDAEGYASKYQYIVVRVYKASGYINVWVDKQWLGIADTIFPDMGNGFIHMSLYEEKDALVFASIVARAV